MSSRARSRSRTRATIATGTQNTFLDWSASKRAAKADLPNVETEDVPRSRRISVGGHARPLARSRSRSRAGKVHMRTKRNPLRSILPWAVLILVLTFLLTAVGRIKENLDNGRAHEALLASREIYTSDTFGVAHDQAIAQALGNLTIKKHKIKDAQSGLRAFHSKFDTVFGAGGLVELNEELPKSKDLDFSRTFELADALGHTLHDVTLEIEVLLVDANQLEQRDPHSHLRHEAALMINRTRHTIEEINSYTPAQRIWAGMKFAYLPRQFYSPTNSDSGSSQGGPVAGLWFSHWAHFLTTRQSEAANISQSADDIKDTLFHFDDAFQRYLREFTSAIEAVTGACKKANEKHKHFLRKANVCEAIHLKLIEGWQEELKVQVKVMDITSELESALSGIRGSYREAAWHVERLGKQIEPLQKRLLREGKREVLGRFREMLKSFLEGL